MAEPAIAQTSVEDVIAEIVRVLRQEVGIGGEISPQSNLQSDLALDSLSLMTLVVSLEDRFRIILREEDAPGIQTVADLAAYVARRVGGTC